MSSDTDESSAQLQNDLRETIANAHSVHRPILTHLNADTTWLLSVPYPPLERPKGRCRFNILIDPWLKGPQSDVGGWFSTQWHVIKSSVQSIVELDKLLKDAEDLELESIGYGNEILSDVPFKTYVDLVAVSHEFTDHCHKATLLEVNTNVPVFSTTKAVALIKSWSHFQNVIDMTDFRSGCDWRTTSTAPLPSWLGVSRLITEGNALYYHSAVIVCIQEPFRDTAEAVIYTPHGVEAATFSTISSANPAVHPLALLHGLHDVSITLTKQLNLGAYNALKAQRLLQSKYWVGTHDEVKKGRGVLAPFLRRKAHNVDDALAKETKSTHNTIKIGNKSHPEVSFTDLRSGESLLLI